MSPALLAHIQAHLDEDLSLDVLSLKAPLSPAHFQRTFQALVGETPKNYVARLRLLIHDVTLLDITLDCGFQNHETFTRAFRRRFGMPHSSYRAWVRT
jgi:transcriptional regulator GlxA family with amidase domain